MKKGMKKFGFLLVLLILIASSIVFAERERRGMPPEAIPPEAMIPPGPPGMPGIARMPPMSMPPMPFMRPEDFAKEMPSRMMHQMRIRGPPPIVDLPAEEMLYYIITSEVMAKPSVKEKIEKFFELCPDTEKISSQLLVIMKEEKAREFAGGDPCNELREMAEFGEKVCRPPEGVFVPECPPKEEDAIEMCKRGFEEHQREMSPENICKEVWENEKESVMKRCEEMNCERMYQECLEIEKSRPQVVPEEVPVVLEKVNETITNETITEVVPEKVNETITNETITGSAISAYIIKTITGFAFEECEEEKGRCEEMQKECTEEKFIERCMEHTRKDFERNKGRAEEECARQAKFMIKEMERGCMEMQRGMEECKRGMEEGKKYMKTALKKCEEVSSEENMQKVAERIAEEMCRPVTFKKPEILKKPIDFETAEIVPVAIAVRKDISEKELDIIKLIVEKIYAEEEIANIKILRAYTKANKIEGIRKLDFVDDVKLDSAARVAQVQARKEKPTLSDVEEMISMLEVAKEKIEEELGEEYTPLISYEQDKIIDTGKKVKNIEAKGIGYKLKWLFGFAAKNEKKEASELREENAKLGKTIERLQKIASQLSDADAITLLQEQIKELQERTKTLEKLAEKKEKRARGILDIAKFFS